MVERGRSPGVRWRIRVLSQPVGPRSKIGLTYGRGARARRPAERATRGADRRVLRAPDARAAASGDSAGACSTRADWYTPNRRDRGAPAGSPRAGRLFLRVGARDAAPVRPAHAGAVHDPHLRHADPGARSPRPRSRLVSPAALEALPAGVRTTRVWPSRPDPGRRTPRQWRSRTILDTLTLKFTE